MTQVIKRLHIGGVTAPLLFGQIMDDSIDTVKNYRSDYYHDAKAIENVFSDSPNEMYVVFGFRPMGTRIYTATKIQDTVSSDCAVWFSYEQTIYRYSCFKTKYSSGSNAFYKVYRENITKIIADVNKAQGINMERAIL